MRHYTPYWQLGGITLLPHMISSYDQPMIGLSFRIAAVARYEQEKQQEDDSESESESKRSLQSIVSIVLGDMVTQ